MHELWLLMKQMMKIKYMKDLLYMNATCHVRRFAHCLDLDTRDTLKCIKSGIENPKT